MKIWTAQTRDGAGPVLIPEGFSIGAFAFGPLWLAMHSAWMFAAIGLAISVVVAVFTPGWASFGLAVLYGLFGHDLRRLALDLRGFTLVHVIAARDAETAFGRLLAARPDLMPACSSGGAAP